MTPVSKPRSLLTPSESLTSTQPPGPSSTEGSVHSMTSDSESDREDSVARGGGSETPLIRYRTELVSSEETESFEGSLAAESSPDSAAETAVLEYVDVRVTDQTRSGDKKSDKPDVRATSKGHGYMRILSPAVNEALRCVVDYWPDLDLSGSIIKVKEPFAVFVFYEKELEEYRRRLVLDDDGIEPSASCANVWANKHLGVALDFVRERTGAAVEAERARHAKGLATFDMLWLLYKPGDDVYFDKANVGEHEPFVMQNVGFDLVNEATDLYELSVWNMNATSRFVGPAQVTTSIKRFAGEKPIATLRVYPTTCLKFDEDIEPGDVEAIREHFVNRGKRWYGLRRQTTVQSFDGFTTTFPRRNFASLVMVDTVQYPLRDFRYHAREANEVLATERATLLSSVTHPSSPLKICDCNRCQELIYKHAVEPRFKGYSNINPLIVEGMTDHQYFLCDRTVEAFLFKLREWRHLDISGFEDPRYDKALFDHLVMKGETKKMIQDLTEMYIRQPTGPSRQESKPYTKITSIHKKQKQAGQQQSTWSADFIKGKGEGLTFLLHGKPGVGKTYTAECIADFTERPLLSLTCADIGVEPESIESNLMYWFKLAENWGAIILIDEADIYMEQREAQDVKRNHLVAGFLRALEYFKGILFLTTNRVGIFDEAFLSRIQVQIYYDDFGDDDRDKIWNTFFEKLEEDRETTMRIPQATKDYTQSQEVRALEWNGREIRNAFQIAVALSEAQGSKDKQGRILVKLDHIRSVVQMSGKFKDYFVKTHRGLDPGKRAAMAGTRYDAFEAANRPKTGEEYH